MTAIELTLRATDAIGEIPAEAWDACANPTAVQIGATFRRCSAAGQDSSPSLISNMPYNPFISHDFLSALELSGSVRARTGWQPMHLLAEEPGGRLVGAVPCYAKSHSQGEYVFDHGWADAYERAGGNYYPKLQVAVPFTPARGRRLLARPTPQSDTVRVALAQ